jgi:hypothetical protein
MTFPSREIPRNEGFEGRPHSQHARRVKPSISLVWNPYLGKGKAQRGDHASQHYNSSNEFLET